MKKNVLAFIVLLVSLLIILFIAQNKPHLPSSGPVDITIAPTAMPMFEKNISYADKILLPLMNRSLPDLPEFKLSESSGEKIIMFIPPSTPTPEPCFTPMPPMKPMDPWTPVPPMTPMK